MVGLLMCVVYVCVHILKYVICFPYGKYICMCSTTYLPMVFGIVFYFFKSKIERFIYNLKYNKNMKTHTNVSIDVEFKKYLDENDISLSQFLDLKLKEHIEKGETPTELKHRNKKCFFCHREILEEPYPDKLPFKRKACNLCWRLAPTESRAQCLYQSDEEIAEELKKKYEDEENE